MARPWWVPLVPTGLLLASVLALGTVDRDRPTPPPAVPPVPAAPSGGSASGAAPLPCPPSQPTHPDVPLAVTVAATRAVLLAWAPPHLPADAQELVDRLARDLDALATRAADAPAEEHGALVERLHRLLADAERAEARLARPIAWRPPRC